MNRKYIGIELTEKYHITANNRHEDVMLGLDPFRRNNIASDQKVKNNEEKRSKSPTIRSGLSKKKVQLMIRDLSNKLGRLPTEEDALSSLNIPKEFYDSYFKNWSEVLSAAKTTGMNENKLVDEEVTRGNSSIEQLKLFIVEIN